ncbi:hypothetical protein FOIG_12100 [Fusarium odoratissimum NRRL 54006]|uniref:Uncharacterized protein n=1 Tax=Fusarium odoratissimum (strain NRRL 54006) TaxID=1089451 RepID=X0JH17_FUSO5|nr:uncharacterized protein FOIG_12100 [Fusarium odoratissimum NRRL 54006]EXL95615.1 hypothetical protein FOIG_12100 [Fusarium odoratissimum NRRL 54006]
MSDDPEKEEAYCNKMRLWGAKWYSNPWQEILDETASGERSWLTPPIRGRPS